MKMKTSSPPINTKEDKGKGGLPRPKRPLSAFNLFYRFKRQKSLSAISLGMTNIDYIRHLIKCPSGLEDYPPNAMDGAAPQVVRDLRRYNISKDLDLLPREDTKQRSHRTNQSAMNGVLSFVEMGKIMNATWKSCDDFARSIFDELADEGRKTYHMRLEAWKKASEGGGAGPTDLKRKYTKIKKPNAEAEAEAQAETPKLKKLKAEDETPKKRKSGGGKMNCTGKASPGPALENITSTIHHEKVFLGAVKQSRQIENVTSDPKACTSPAPHLKSKQQDPISNGYDQLLARVAKSNIALPTATMSMSQQAGLSHGQFQGQPYYDYDDETNLRMRVLELEGQLASEKLHARIRRLESDLANHRSIQGQLRALLDTPGCERASSATTAYCPPLYIQGNGHYEDPSRAQLMPGAVPSVLNPVTADLSRLETLVQASEFYATFSKMATTRDASTLHSHSAMSHPSAQAVGDLRLSLNDTNANFFPNTTSERQFG